MGFKRIHFRLYPDDPDDARVIEWLESLPVGPSGRQRLKAHIVSVLAKEANRQLRGAKKRTSPSGDIPRARRKPKRGKSIEPVMPEFEEPVAEKNHRANGGTEPKLPDFGA